MLPTTTDRVTAHIYAALLTHANPYVVLKSLEHTQTLSRLLGETLDEYKEDPILDSIPIESYISVVLHQLIPELAMLIQQSTTPTTPEEDCKNIMLKICQLSRELTHDFITTVEIWLKQQRDRRISVYTTVL